MKKWFPFIALISVALLFSVYLLMSGETSPYTPETNDPLEVYAQACAHCHGPKGQGSGLFYPALKPEELTAEAIRKAIIEGDLLMPAFPNINDTLMDSLAQNILNEKYPAVRK